jgi:hypothetical protein
MNSWLVNFFFQKKMFLQNPEKLQKLSKIVKNGLVIWKADKISLSLKQ